jgi:hypothetical protein
MLRYTPRPPQTCLWMVVRRYHNYVGYGLDPQLAPKIMDPSGKFFDSGPGRAAAMIDGWKTIGKPRGMQIWVGEIAAAWHSGEPGVTNRFISSFWYADALGLLASLNHTGFCRQSLRGGNYGLLNRTTGEPNPDFYMAQMFRNEMGPDVLSLSSNMKSEGLRTYAHCHPTEKGRATMLFVNVDPTKTFTVSIPAAIAAGTDAAVDAAIVTQQLSGLSSQPVVAADGNVTLWSFAAGDGTKEKWNGLDSRLLQLNGKPLLATTTPSPYALPKLAELGVAVTNVKELKIPPLTINFVATDAPQHC